MEIELNGGAVRVFERHGRRWINVVDVGTAIKVAFPKSFLLEWKRSHPFSLRLEILPIKGSRHAAGMTARAMIYHLARSRLFHAHTAMTELFDYIEAGFDLDLNTIPHEKLLERVKVIRNAREVITAETAETLNTTPLTDF